ncbi:zf-HC2 domain-containing protein [Sutcliffiella horikoshii]|uniref:zf-HC2 domain-containing protein n=1 Tax=Sutcliffiella horikoshii TaxID=79883 RepID=UPI00203D55A7|nr:zf-HC2 domain-containing protein [Sutcliffiella horikoshii]MCM3620207.1 zf-HC2 domain-containing protein [Sutcliffiella horikoshii]
MKCFEFNQLAAYVDGVLSQDEKKEVENHIEFCPSCREVVAALKKEDAFLQEVVQSPVLPAGFDDEVLSKLEPYKVKKKKRNWPYQLLTAASIILAMGLGAAFYSGTQESDGGNTQHNVIEEEESPALYSVEDQGILLEVTDISASPLKIEVFYRLKPEESVIDEFLKKHNVEHLSQVRVEYETLPPNGKIVDMNGEDLPFREVSFGGNDRLENSIVIKPGDVENLPDTFKMQVDFEELFLQDGSWNLEIPIDIKEAKANTSKYSMQSDFQFDDFSVNLLEGESSENAHRITIKSEYSESEKERLVDIMMARGEDGEEYSMIMPEVMVVTKNYKQHLLTNGTTLHSYMGQSFTTEFEFANRIKGMGSKENLPVDEDLLLIIEGFRLHEPENTQFELTDQSENVQVNDWIIESVTTEPETSNSKIVTIKGRTSIESIEDFIIEVKGDNKRFTTESISNRVTSEGEFVLQTNMPNSTEIYNLDIQKITKWIPYEKEITLNK